MANKPFIGGAFLLAWCVVVILTSTTSVLKYEPVYSTVMPIPDAAQTTHQESPTRPLCRQVEIKHNKSQKLGL